MNIKPQINGKLLDIFNAEMLKYEIGPCNFEGGHVLPPSATFPILLAGKIGVRNISITLDFTGDTARQIALSISEFTEILHKGCELFLPDGFEYFCVFNSASTPTEMAPWISQVSFSLIGVRHDSLVTKKFSTGENTIYIEGNCNAPAIIRIKATDTEVTVCGFTVTNITDEVIINGIDITALENGVNKYGDIENMTEFPKFPPGYNTFEIVGNAEVTISYYPIYI